MIKDMAGADLSKPFKFKLSDYGIEEEQETGPTNKLIHLEKVLYQNNQCQINK
jgi:hypothetical protein